MFAAQLAAIRKLERALRACDEAGIALCGMDDQLIAYDARALRETQDRHGGRIYEAQRDLSDAGESVTVHDHGAYRESGGW